MMAIRHCRWIGLVLLSLMALPGGCPDSSSKNGSITRAAAAAPETAEVGGTVNLAVAIIGEGDLSARINLALLEGDPESLERLERECTAFAPLLMAELDGSPAERLEQVLTAMRGNRSSSEWTMSYHLWGRLWRRGMTADGGPS